jgi:acetylglutamate kinase
VSGASSEQASEQGVDRGLARAVVVKLGGEVVASAELPQIARDLAQIASDRPLVVVHGGGPQATTLQQRLGQSPQKIAGRRVTDAATLEVMKMAVAGSVNVDLCSALVGAGARPVGMNGTSSRVIAAEKRPARVYSGAGPDPIDLGLVGDVTAVDAELLGLLAGRGYVPVLACLGAGPDGQPFNINADIVATRVAVALHAESLVVVSDVRGVLREISDPSSRIARLSIAEGRELIASGVASGGMIPKLEECFVALEAGARQVHIVGKLAPGELSREAREPGSIGTVLVP